MCSQRHPSGPKEPSHLFHIFPFSVEPQKSACELFHLWCFLWSIGVSWKPTLSRTLCFRATAYILHQPQHLGYTPAFKSPTPPHQPLVVRMGERSTFPPCKTLKSMQEDWKYQFCLGSLVADIVGNKVDSKALEKGPIFTSGGILSTGGWGLNISSFMWLISSSWNSRLFRLTLV